MLKMIFAGREARAQSFKAVRKIRRGGLGRLWFQFMIQEEALHLSLFLLNFQSFSKP